LCAEPLQFAEPIHGGGDGRRNLLKNENREKRGKKKKIKKFDPFSDISDNLNFYFFSRGSRRGSSGL
jgi:hypothetical protein